ncbi:MAG: elongation factor Ts [Oscillospiraceae bacterium]|nr:elongation factor Ts [Oscillospiraceae bacterium]MBQ8732779.1 elongation factor Ts [Oscillospiraceae bacterium]
MAAFTPKDVAALRERTGCGMMACKKALTDAEGDMDKAIELLREQGLAASAKKASRIAAEGIVAAELSADGSKGVLIEVNSETDFVAKNEKFQAFVSTIAKTVLATGAADVETLLTQKVVDSDMTVQELLNDNILTIGENLKIRRFAIADGPCVPYIHAGGKIGVMVMFDADDAVAAKSEFAVFGKDVAMQVAAANPLFLSREDVPADVIEKEKEILTAQAINEGKPANIAEKMVMGRIQKYYKENCLVEQEFVKDPDLTIQKYTDKTAKELGGNITVKGFVRFERGEGLEKRSDDFAAEVANMVK